MKKFAFFFAMAIIALTTAIPASAQLKFGLKAGVAVNDLKFNSVAENFDVENRAGFTGGAMLEFTAPVLGLGIDASVMYVHRTVGDKTLQEEFEHFNSSRDYIDIPLNLKWKISIPVISNVIKPYLATGPSFAFLVSKNDFKEFIEEKKCDVSWNFGAGVELFNHLQIGASYGIGLTKAMETIKVVDDMPTIEGKNRYWTITAAYLF